MIANYLRKLREFIAQCRRVLIVASKPNKEEFVVSLKIVLVGMFLLGIIAFVVFLIAQLFSEFL